MLSKLEKAMIQEERSKKIAFNLKTKKEFREKRTSSLRAALEAKKEAEKAVREELKALGYTSSDEWSPFRYRSVFF